MEIEKGNETEREVEELIDQWTSELPPLTAFVLRSKLRIASCASERAAVPAVQTSESSESMNFQNRKKYKF